MVMVEKEILFGTEKLVLTNQRAVFHKSSKSLIIADLHLGKTTHFRKHGMAIPSNIAEEDLKRLGALLKRYNVERVYLAGDFFHASVNSEIGLFQTWKEEFKKIDFLLIMGNHDRLPKPLYQELGFEVLKEGYHLNGLKINHHPQEQPLEYSICGHIHPGIKIRGQGRQTLKLPCYIQQEKQLILPAFSKFTGLDTSYSQTGIVYGFDKNDIFVFSKQNPSSR